MGTDIYIRVVPKNERDEREDNTVIRFHLRFAINSTWTLMGT